MSSVENIHRARAPDWLMMTALLACSGASILSTDLYTPSLPHLPEILATTPSAVQLTMGLNLVAYAGCQLIYGPLADRLGRRTLLMWGLIGFFLSTLLCAVAPTIEVLIAARIAQGIFASAEAVITLLMLRELFEGEKGAKAMGLFGVGIGLFPAIGPLIGGYVHVLVGWRANFVLMAGMIVVAGIIAMSVLPETKIPDKDALNLRRVGRNYLSLLRDRTILRFMAPLAASMGALFAFVTEGPFILIDRLGVPTEEYGYWYALIVVFFMLGSLAVNRLAGRRTPEALTRDGVVTVLFGTLLLCLPLFAGYEKVWAIIAGMSAMALGFGLIFGSAPLPLLDAAGDERRGAASALMGLTEIGGAALGALAVGVFHDGTALPFAITTLAWALFSAGVFRLLKP